MTHENAAAGQAQSEQQMCEDRHECFSLYYVILKIHIISVNHA